MNHHPNHNHQQQQQQHQKQPAAQQQQPQAAAPKQDAPKQEDNLAAILERANRKLQEEIVPIDVLTHKQAILEQRIRLTDEALKKLSSQQLHLGIDEVPRQDLQDLLRAASVPFEQHFSDQQLRDLVKNFLSSL